MLYVDIPGASDLQELTEQRDEISVSFYLLSTPVTRDAESARIELKSLLKEAVDELHGKGRPQSRVSALEELVDELVDDEEFWRYQANSLAVFATPDRLRYYRLPNALEREFQVSDRFGLAQLLRAVTFPNAAVVLVLAEGEARVVEVSADRPATTVTIPGLPEDAEPFKTQPVADRMPRARAQGTKGDASALRQFARHVDQHLRDQLRGSGLPLVLAAAEPMTSIFPAINSYPGLVETVIEDGQHLSDSELAARVRPILDELYREQNDRWRERFADRLHGGLGATDVASVARAATFGAVESLMVDMTQRIEGTLDESDGSLQLVDAPQPGSYDVLGEIAARVLRTGGRVIAVRAEDLPDKTTLAAILRYSI